jgi:hypothetical protein
MAPKHAQSTGSVDRSALMMSNRYTTMSTRTATAAASCHGPGRVRSATATTISSHGCPRRTTEPENGRGTSSASKAAADERGVRSFATPLTARTTESRSGETSAAVVTTESYVEGRLGIVVRM